MRTLDKLESRQRIREIRELWLWWDPIGVSAMPEAADEYDAYLAPTLRLLERNASSAELAAFLDSVAYGRMGLSGVTTPARPMRP